MFQHSEKSRKFLAQPCGVEKVAQYGIGLKPAQPAAGSAYWKVIGVHHLSPGENRGRHNAYVEVLDERGQRINDPNLRIGWSWPERTADQAAPLIPLDKPANEPAGDVPIGKKMDLELWIEGDGLPSECIHNMHTRHADEPGPNGEIWNSRGHHSYYIVFQRTAGDAHPASYDSTGVGSASTLTDLLVQEGKRRQVLELNAEAALQKRIFADGFVPNSTEFTLAHGNAQYMGQQAQHLASGKRRIYYVPVGDWDNVQYVASA